MPDEESPQGPRRRCGAGFHQRVYTAAASVPPGWVTTYGDLAQALGSARLARQVGFALAALPAFAEVPWWRVVAAGGRLSTAPATARRQAAHLRAEGVTVRGDRVADFAGRRFWLAIDPPSRNGRP